MLRATSTLATAATRSGSVRAAVVTLLAALLAVVPAPGPAAAGGLLVTTCDATTTAAMVLEFEADEAGDRGYVLLGSEYDVTETVNVRVDWGDGNFNDYTDVGVKEHTYATSGTYTVRICPRYADEGGSDTGPWLTLYGGDEDFFGDSFAVEFPDLFDDFTDLAQLVKVVSFGDLGITSLRNAFQESRYLTDVPNSLPTTVTDLGYLFDDADAFNDPDVGSWDVSRVTEFRNMFKDAVAFNQSLVNWDVSSGVDFSDMFEDATSFNGDVAGWVFDTDPAAGIDADNMFENASAFNDDGVLTWNTIGFGIMSDMFKDAGSFNQPIGVWNVANVTDMDDMFENAVVFNQPLAAWDVSSVTDMSGMFEGAIVFDQPLADWDVSSVTDMSGMFEGAIVFDQPLADWVVSSVTNMTSMFEGAIVFDRPIEAWNVGNVEDMEAMFRNADAFNQPIGGWVVSNVTDMESMFRDADAFDQPLGAWDVSNVTSMTSMFRGALAFNQPIGDWDVSSVVDHRSMFRGAVAFDRDLGSWTLLVNTEITDLFTGSGMSSSCYDATLIGWVAGGPPDGLVLGADGVEYSPAGAAARTTLIDTYNWTFVNDVPVATAAGGCLVGTFQLDNTAGGTRNGFVFGGQSDAASDGEPSAEVPGAEVSDASSFIAPTGMLDSPYYFYKPASGTSGQGYYGLTYRPPTEGVPLSFAIGHGTGGSNPLWTGNTKLVYSQEDNFREDPVVGVLKGDVDAGSSVAFARTADTIVAPTADPANERGSGTLTVKGTIAFDDGKVFEITHVYTLLDSTVKNWAKAETTVKNVSGSAASNVNIWVGTADDWIETTDAPVKIKGLVTGEGDTSRFSARCAGATNGIITYTDAGATAGAYVMLYSPSVGAQSILSAEYDDWNEKIVALDPAESEFEVPSTDGSYGLNLPVGDLGDGAEKTLVWYYEGGSLTFIPPANCAAGAERDRPFDGIAISCLPDPVRPGAIVECWIEGPDAADAVRWQAAYNPTFATGTAVTDARGRGYFTFRAPIVPSGTVLTVSLPDDDNSTTVTVIGSPVPLGIPSGQGASLSLAGLVLVLAAARLLRRRRGLANG